MSIRRIVIEDDRWKKPLEIGEPVEEGESPILRESVIPSKEIVAAMKEAITMIVEAYGTYVRIYAPVDSQGLPLGDQK